MGCNFSVFLLYVCSPAYLPYKSTFPLMMSAPPLWCVYFIGFNLAWLSHVAHDIWAIRAMAILILLCSVFGWMGHVNVQMYIYRCCSYKRPQWGQKYPLICLKWIIWQSCQIELGVKLWRSCICNELYFSPISYSYKWLTWRWHKHGNSRSVSADPSPAKLLQEYWMARQYTRCPI